MEREVQTDGDRGIDTERHRERERETDRQTDRQTKTETDRDRNRDRDRDKGTHRGWGGEEVGIFCAECRCKNVACKHRG